MKTVDHIINNNGLLRINLSNLSDNYSFLSEFVKPSRVASVLKSNSYGLGLEKVAKKLLGLGCKDFFLTSFEEAIRSKKITSKGNVILLNGIIGQSEKKFTIFLKVKLFL